MSAPSRLNGTPGQRLTPGDGSGPANGRGQLLFGALNEKIRRVSDTFALAEALDLVCECQDGDCFARLSISRDEYESVRRFATRFLVNPQHVSLNERVVHETRRYAVVENVELSTEEAVVLDPQNATADEGER
jgi:hypothetical protein